MYPIRRASCRCEAKALRCILRTRHSLEVKEAFVRFGARVLFSCFLWVAVGVCQSVAPSMVTFPHVIRYSGVVPSSVPAGQREVRVTFRLFSYPTGGAALWQETQTIAVQNGKLNALIGATSVDGVPESVFAGNAARWLEVQLEGEATLPRTELASVPYAMKAASADLFAGRPLSEFVLRNGPLTQGSSLLADTTAYATLGSNSFVGNQNVNGNVISTAAVNAASSTITSPATVSQLLWVKSTATSGSVISIKAANSSSAGTALYGTALSLTGNTFGVYGTNSSSTGVGVFGLTTAGAGSGEAVKGQAAGTSGHGVAGYATNVGGLAIGVYGQALSSKGTGVMGESKPSVNGFPTFGVVGKAHGNLGTAVQAIADSTTGATVGLQATVTSASGTAGLFANAGLGNILIGQSGPTRVFRVDGNGTVFANGGVQSSGADFAESIAVRGDRQSYVPGDVLAIDEEQDRQVKLADEPYSTRVIGIYSTKPGTLSSTHPMDAPEFADEIPVAVVGIVPCKVTAANGAIHRGDLLVSSSLSGYAMKATDRGLTPGAIVGKAMQELQEGDGVIDVLVTLE
jgi:hypothetical protein